MVAAMERSEGEIGYTLLGAVLLLAFFAQELFALKPHWLVALQGDETYKQLTGLLLVLFIANQWQLSLRRLGHKNGDAPGDCRRHKWWGALAPLFFYVHSHQLGYAYLLLLSSVYFSDIFLGLLHCFSVHAGRGHWFKGWLVIHVAAALTLVPLVAFHAYTAFWYQ